MTMTTTIIVIYHSGDKACPTTTVRFAEYKARGDALSFDPTFEHRSPSQAKNISRLYDVLCTFVLDPALIQIRFWSWDMT